MITMTRKCSHKQCKQLKCNSTEIYHEIISWYWQVQRHIMVTLPSYSPIFSMHLSTLVPRHNQSKTSSDIVHSRHFRNGDRTSSNTVQEGRGRPLLWVTMFGVVMMAWVQYSFNIKFAVREHYTLWCGAV